jgi:hypothetical protein
MGKRLTEWEKLKRKGNAHYKSTPGGVEPFDLLKAGGLLYPSCIKDIIKCAYRCRPNAGRAVGNILEDMDEVIHYAETVKVLVSESVIVKPKKKRIPKPLNLEPADASKT